MILKLIKRLIDIFFSLAGCLVLALPMLLIALLIRMDSSGPIIFKQQRIGFKGKKFTMFKFRTMVIDAEKKKAGLKHLNIMSEPAFKVINDPRLTKIGGALRRWALDEVPQFINILKGEMSFIGPRPHLIDEVKHYAPGDEKRLAMPPGLVCSFQVKNGLKTDFREWIEMDKEYIRNWSLWQDIKIAFTAIAVIIHGQTMH